MKKLFILSFASILLLTGCGATETLSCSYKNNSANGSSKVTYDIDHEGDEVKKVRITYDYNFNNNTDNGTNGTTNNDIQNRARVGDNTTGNNTNNDNNNGITGDASFGANDVGNTARNNNTNGNNTTATDNTNDGTNGMTGNNTDNNNNVTTYNNDNNNNNNGTDGVGTGTDGTTNDTQIDDDGVVDGVVGSAIDTIVGTVTDIILDSAGLKERHATVQSTYGNVTGFTAQNTTDNNDNYKVTYVIDYDTISNDDLSRFNLSRDLEDLRDSYVNQGFTCK